MVSKDILNGVYEFIKNNRDRNQSDIVKGLKKVCTRLPVLDALDELTSDKDGTEEPKVKFSRNTPKGSYHYYVNDKNEYNLLEKRISELYQMAEELDEQVKMVNRSPDYLSMKNKARQFSKFNLLVSNLIQTRQMIRYSKMAQLANEIQEKIKSNEERETLYLQLVRVFTLTSKSNVSTMLLVFTEAFVATVDEINNDEELPAGLKNLVNTWIFGTQDVQRKIRK